MNIDLQIKPSDLSQGINRLFALASQKVMSLHRSWDPGRGTPVFTVEGQYTSRGWTEWTQGFQYGCAILTFDVTDDAKLLKLAKKQIVEHMAPHVSHTGVHDHGFNNLSTYGNLRRLMHEGRIDFNQWELNFYELALKVSGAIQAARWSGVAVNQPNPHSAQAASLGYIYSFNGPHSLFVDTMRSCRSLGIAWQLGQPLMHENDKSANLLKRSILHGLTTSQYIVFHGDSRHSYDVAGRTCHEAVFNTKDGQFRSRATQQGYSPFSTWTRGLAWAILGYAEELEFLGQIDESIFENSTGLARSEVLKVYENCARQTAGHYLDDVTASDGIPYWDDGAPNLHKLGDWKNRPAEPINPHEPVDSSAAAIAAQGLLRLGHYLGKQGGRYTQAGLSIARTLLTDQYLATSETHQGLLLHSIYHRPNNWDHISEGQTVPSGESSLWGDYHLLELAVLIHRMAADRPYLTFYDPTKSLS